MNGKVKIVDAPGYVKEFRATVIAGLHEVRVTEDQEFVTVVSDAQNDIHVVPSRCVHEVGPNEPRSIREITEEILSDWKKPSPAAVPHLDAMVDLEGAHDRYGAESAASIVRSFLGNARTWRGETARRVKAELASIIEGVF